MHVQWILHFQREKNSEFSGMNLLDPNRIRAMSSDVSRRLKRYDKVDKHESNSKDILSLQNTCFQRVNSIVPHHCGDHSCCKASHFKQKSMQLSEKNSLWFQH